MAPPEAERTYIGRLAGRQGELADEAHAEGEEVRSDDVRGQVMPDLVAAAVRAVEDGAQRGAGVHLAP